MLSCEEVCFGNSLGIIGNKMLGDSCNNRSKTAPAGNYGCKSCRHCFEDVNTCWLYSREVHVHPAFAKNRSNITNPSHNMHSALVCYPSQLRGEFANKIELNWRILSEGVIESKQAVNAFVQI